MSKKYIPSAKALHTEDLSNITFNYLSEKSPNSVCHFLNHKSFFTTQLLCICLAQTLHTCYKSSPSKSKFSDSPLLLLKFTEFLMSSFQTNSQFFFKVWITLQCADRSFFCTFLAETLYPTDKSSTSKCKFPDLPLLALKFNKLFMLFLEPRVTFPSNLASLFSVTRNNSSVLFHLNLYMFLIKSANLTSTARMKINQIPYVIFQALSQCSFKLCITLQCHDA